MRSDEAALPSWAPIAFVVGLSAAAVAGCGSDVRGGTGGSTTSGSDCDSEGIDCFDACGDFIFGSCINGVYVCDDPGTGGCGGQGGSGGGPAAEWSVGLGDGDGYQAGLAVAVAPDGDLVVAVCFASTIDLGGGVLVNADPTAEFDCDIALARLTATGLHLWSRAFGAVGKEYATDVAVDSAGNIVLAGSVMGTLDFGLGPIGPGGYFLAKFDPSGEPLWSQAMPGSSPKLQLALDPSDQIVVVTSCAPGTDYGGGPVQTAGDHDACVVAFNPDGTYSWHATVGGPGYDQGRDIAINENGDIAVCGSFTGTLPLPTPVTSHGATDGFVAQIDGASGPVWAVAIGGAGLDSASTVAWDSDGPVVSGWFQSSADLGSGPVGATGDNGFVVWLDATGAHRADLAFGGLSMLPFGTEEWSLASDLDGGVVLGGQFQGTFQIGPHEIDQAGDHDHTSDGALARLAPAGEVAWAIGFGDANAEKLNGLAVAPSGSVLVTGSYYGGPDLGNGKLPGAGNGDMYFASFPLYP